MHPTLWQGSYKHDNFSLFGKSNNLVSKYPFVGSLHPDLLLRKSKVRSGDVIQFLFPFY